MELRFAKFDPSGNTTILVLDPVPRESHAALAQTLMRATDLCAEQVGFLETGENGAAARLQMMGGEFCGNASRCLAAYLAAGTANPTGRANDAAGSSVVAIEVSGHRGFLEAAVTTLGPHRWDVSIDMPLPQAVLSGHDARLGDYSMVPFEGILHLVLWDREAEESLVRFGLDFLAASGLPADTCGILFYDSRVSFLTPVVAVGAVRSLVYEQSCGSGTVAVGAALSERTGRPVEGLRVVQPGGVLTVSVDRTDRITAARLSGPIRLAAEGRAFVEDIEVNT